jgi:hypothetical protein
MWNDQGRICRKVSEYATVQIRGMQAQVRTQTPIVMSEIKTICLRLLTYDAVQYIHIYFFYCCTLCHLIFLDEDIFLVMASVFCLQISQARNFVYVFWLGKFLFHERLYEPFLI